MDLPAVLDAADGVPGQESAIRQQQVEIVFTQAPAALGAALIVALVLSVSLWNVADQSFLLAWFGVQLLLTAVRMWHVYCYRQAGPEARNDPQWEKLFLLGTLFSGIAWGCIGLIYSPAWGAEYQVLVVISLTGLQAGAVSSYSAITGIYIAFMAPSILIFAQSLLVHNVWGQQVLGLLFLLGGGALLTISRNTCKNTIRSLQLRHEHQELLRKMASSNAALETEVSTRQEAENELLRERQLFTEGPVIVYRCRAESGWPVEYISETISGFGYEAENIIRQQMPFADLIHSGDLARVEGTEMQAGRKGLLSLGLDYRLMCADGDVRWVYDYIVPIVNRIGEITHYSGYILDITDRKRTEFELQTQKDRVQVTLHSIADAVITTDVNGQIEYLNPMAERLTGWVNEIAHGLPISRVFCLFDEDSRESIENPVSRCLATAVATKSGKDCGLRRHDGETFSIQYSISPIKNEEGGALGVIIVFTDVTETRMLQRKVSYQASHDSLTGLINRHAFEIQLEQVISSSGSNSETHALCCLNIDQFKLVNDTCSHDAGDKMLVEITTVLRSCLRDTDVLARIGGDEFGVLLMNCSLEDAVILADTVLHAVREMKFTGSETGLDTSVSIGVVSVDEESASVTAVMSAADLACYAAKDFGGNRLHIYQSGDQELARRHTEMQWVSKLTAAIESDRLVLYCQEIVPISQDSEAGSYFEVLVRMLDAEGGIIPPDMFLPAAERYNMIATLDRWVVSHCFAWYADNRAAIKEGGLDTMSINLSGASVTDDGFMKYIRNEMQEYGVDPKRICFEITETAAIANMDAAVNFISGLKKSGCRFSLDDFGSGLSSFAYLKKLPVDYLKIDGSFVKNMESDAVDCAMVSAIHQLGSLVGIKTVAEFVENNEILKKLEAIGVDYAQGYGISRPAPLDQLVIGVFRKTKVVSLVKPQ